ncbi:MAG: SPFH domain-containing protein, partial [Chlamydiota bacterium]|nr:SPFH domain-containing protein [Chlamydiota bacterium]
NPFFYEWKIVPITDIPLGKAGILTSKVGSSLPEESFLADEGQKGIRRQVLGPGKYRLNPEGYKIDIIEALFIDIGFVGVVTSLDGETPPKDSFAGPGQRGVRQDILQPGLYYINPKQYKVDIVEIGINQISLLGALESEQMMQSKGAGLLKERREKTNIQVEKHIAFPSKDGFEIHVDTTVEFELLPPNISAIFSHYGNLEAVINKIILPQILSVSRLKGSDYGARDFIVGEGREKFQNDFADKLEKTLEAKDIEILSAMIRHVTVPRQILQPIQDASVAKERDLTNQEKQSTAKKLAELNTERSLIEQRTEQIQQETKKLKAEIQADQHKEVAEINADTEKKVSMIAKETALVLADVKRKLGKAEAQALQLIGEAKAKGLGLFVTAFKDPQAYTYYNLSELLPNDMRIKILYAGDGTLWTDMTNPSPSEMGGLKILGTIPPSPPVAQKKK